MFALRDKLENVWTHRWSGVVLTLAFAATGLCLFVRVPAPGVSVAVMGGAAAVLSLRAKATGTEKATWMILLACFLVIEVAAIRKDRRENQEAEAQRVEEQRRRFDEIATGIETSIKQANEHFDKTMQSAQNEIGLEKSAAAQLTESLSNETGGESFPYVCSGFSKNNSVSPELSLCGIGKYPLHHISIEVQNLGLRHWPTQTAAFAEGPDLGYAESIPLHFDETTLLSPVSHSFQISSSARNGNWLQELHWRKVKDPHTQQYVWKLATLLHDFLCKPKKPCMLRYLEIHDGFPVEELKADDWWNKGLALPRSSACLHPTSRGCVSPTEIERKELSRIIPSKK